MEFNSQMCTTKEQSERLLALGMKKDTADMMYSKTSYGEFIFVKDDDYLEHLDFPAWSLHRLIEMMPCGFQDEHYRNFVLKINSQDVSYVYNYVDDEGYGQSDSIYVDDIYHNLYDGIIAHIKWLIKKGLFNKEYLEE